MVARAQSLDWVPAMIAVPLCAAIGVLAGIEPKFAVFAALGLIFILVALTDLAAALAVLIVVVFAETTPLAGPALSATKLTGLLLTLAWIARVATHPRSREAVIFTEHPTFSYLLALFLGWITISVSWAENFSLAIDQTTVFLLVAVLYVIVFTAVQTRRQVVLVIGAFIGGTAIAAMYGLATRPAIDGYAVDRLVSTVRDPNFLAAILVAGIALALGGMLAARRRPGLRFLAGVSLALCLAAFFLTGSRGGVVGLAAALIAAIVFGGRWRGRMAIAATTLTIVAVGYYTIYAPPEITDRFATASQGEVSQRDTRYTIWTVAWRMVEDNPVIGVGIGNFEQRSPEYVLEPGTTFRTDRVIDNPGVSHNTFLGPLAELGIVGVSLFIAIVGFSVSCAVRAAWLFANDQDLEMEALARGLVVAMVGMFSAGFFISAESNKIIWLLMAMGPAMLSVARSSAAETPQ